MLDSERLNPLMLAAEASKLLTGTTMGLLMQTLHLLTRDVREPALRVWG